MGSRCCGIVAASDFNREHFLRAWRAGEFDCVVAVDAGFAHLREAGCGPDVMIGDFDSLGYVPSGDNVLVHPTHKDKSDLELAFDWVVERGFGSVAVYGALGGRLDHTLANLQMCARYAERGLEVSFVDLESAVTILVGPGELELPALDRGTVSVFSAVEEATGVTERGMEYPLEDACLSNRTSLGLSNELVGHSASVSVKSGTLYVFHPLLEL